MSFIHYLFLFVYLFFIKDATTPDMNKSQEPSVTEDIKNGGENSRLGGQNSNENQGNNASIIGAVLGVAVAVCILIIIALVLYIIR